MEFEQRYFDLKLKFQNKIDAIDASRSINVSGQNISIAIPTKQSNANFRLPKLNIPVFSGKFEDWINFKDLFVTAVYSQTSLGNIQKFQYLKGLLSDESAFLIKHIPLSNESYEEAWGKLIDRYDKKKQIVYALIKTFLDQKGISQVNMTNLRNLVDTSDEVLRGLKAFGTEATNKDHWLIQILMQKLDTETKRLWSVKTAEKDFPTLKEFLEFLNRLSLSGISGIQAGTTRGSVGLKIGSRFCKDQLTIKAYILNKVTSQIPVERVNIKELDYLEGIRSADDDFSKPSESDAILGSNCFFSILRNSRITGSKGQPITQSTIFGWVVAGKIQGNFKSFMQSHLIRVENECNVDSILQQFWQIEELPLKKISSSEEEEFCETHFKATYKFNNEGRFMVKLPIYRDINQLGNTRGLAVFRFIVNGK
ncbi:uncharacterized protein TNCV_2309941 [Trichonephila clavipes]|nr:uncharacterized protein TNCV_2309941 [Trichonephila clavipes]